MNLAARLYLVVGSLLVAACWAMAWFGTSLSRPSSETAPVSVRENPATFRSSYVIWTGWHPLPVRSSSGGGTSGGGFGFGK